MFAFLLHTLFPIDNGHWQPSNNRGHKLPRLIHGHQNDPTYFKGTLRHNVIGYSPQCPQTASFGLTDTLTLTQIRILRMQRRIRNAADGVEEPEFPILRGAMNAFAPMAPVRAANPPPPRNFRRSSARLRAESPDTAIEYDQKELDALERMRDLADRQIKGLSFINDMRKDSSFVVVDDDVRAVREAEERYLNREVDAHLKAISEGKINRAAILLIMSPLCNYVERLELELKNTRNLLSDIQGRQADLAAELKHVETMNKILKKGTHTKS